MANQRKSKKQLKPVSIIALVVCSCVVLLFGVSIAKEVIEFKQKKTELTNAESAYESQLSENEALDKEVKEGDKDAIMEKYAREKGYVMPDERVYVDITPGA